MLQDWMLAPHDPRFSAAQWLIDHDSPRLDDMPELGVWIDQAAKQYNLNARWLLVLAQKEQSAITATTLGERGKNWLMGYGATDGGDLPGYAGPRNQVFSAARGLRGYLEPSGHYAPGMVGKPYPVGDGGSYTPQTVAEAASLLYTPWIHGLRLHEKIWETWFDGEERSTMRQDDVAIVAEEVLRRARAGEQNFRVNGVPFEATDRAYCAEFVRECHAAVTGVLYPAWADDAIQMERNLYQAGHAIDEPVRGCVVAFCQDKYNRYGREACWNASDAWLRARNAWGHVAIYVGNNRVIENSNGFGTRTLDQVGRARISGYYAPLEIADNDRREELVVLEDPTTEFGRTFEVLRHDDGRVFVPARTVFEALGYEVRAEHLDERRRVYVKPTAEVVGIAERIANG